MILGWMPEEAQKNRSKKGEQTREDQQNGWQLEAFTQQMYHNKNKSKTGCTRPEILSMLIAQPASMCVLQYVLWILRCTTKRRRKELSLSHAPTFANPFASIEQPHKLQKHGDLLWSNSTNDAVINRERQHVSTLWWERLGRRGAGAGRWRT